MSAVPSIATLNTRAALRAPVRAPDALGGASVTLITIATVWARFETEVAVAEVTFGRAVARNRASLTLRSRSDIKPGWQVNVAGRDWLVETAPPPPPGAPFQTLSLSEFAP